MCQTIDRTIGASRETSMCFEYISRGRLFHRSSRKRAGHSQAAARARGSESRAPRARQGRRPRDGKTEHAARGVSVAAPRARRKRDCQTRRESTARIIVRRFLVARVVGSTKRPNAAASESAIIKCTLEYASGQERVYPCHVASRRDRAVAVRVEVRERRLSCGAS